MNTQLLDLLTKRVWLMMAFFLYFVNASSFDFEVDGLCYNKLSDNQVEVTYKYVNGNSYSGNLSIPDIINYNGKTYNVTSIGNYAFNRCSNFTGPLIIPNSVTSIGDYAFYLCEGLNGSLKLSNSLTSIGHFAFGGCENLCGELIIPNSVTTVGTYAFANCKKFTGTLTISNNLTLVDNSTFYGCNGFTGLLEIPNSVKEIGDKAFSGCKGFSGLLNLPNGVKSIGKSAFSACSGFDKILIPNTVESIGTNAFNMCSNVTKVISLITTPFAIEESVFELYLWAKAVLYIPKNTKSSYLTFPGWINNFHYCPRKSVNNSLKRLSALRF